MKKILIFLLKYDYLLLKGFVLTLNKKKIDNI